MDNTTQWNDICNMFNSAKNQYLQLRDKDDGQDTWLKDINNWVFEFKHKIYNWLRQQKKDLLRLYPLLPSCLSRPYKNTKNC